MCSEHLIINILNQTYVILHSDAWKQDILKNSSDTEIIINIGELCPCK